MSTCKLKEIEKYLFIISFLLCYHSISIAQEVEKKSKFKLSFSERIRLSTLDKAFTLDKNKDVRTLTRWRTSIGAEYTPNRYLGIKLEIANEARIYMSPSSSKTSVNEIFVNQLYIDYNNIANLPLGVRIGRQDILLDEGFICIDGNPLVGSRSKYFNAIKTDYQINDKNAVTAFFTYNTRRDKFLPIIHEKDPYKLLEEQTNSGLGIYYKSKIKNINLSAYYFYKKYFEYEAYPDANTHAIGSRIQASFLNNFMFTTEFAYQFGKVGAFNRQSYGGYSRLEYNFNESVPIINQISLGGIYLSGDNPKTEKVEGWDPLWSRFPVWSVSYFYTLKAENKGKIGYWSNMNSINVGIKTSLAKNVKFKVNYHYLSAPQLNDTQFCSGGGKTRGHLYMMRLTYQINKRWAGHFLWEHFAPGNFYFKGADKYNWTRFQLTYKL